MSLNEENQRILKKLDEKYETSFREKVLIHKIAGEHYKKEPEEKFIKDTIPVLNSHELVELQVKLDKLRIAKNALHSELKRKETELEEANKNLDLRYLDQRQLEKELNEILKELKHLRGVLAEIGKTGEMLQEKIAENLSLKKTIYKLENSQLHEQLILRKLQDLKFNPRQWVQLRNVDHQYPVLLQKHRNLQDLFKQKTKLLNIATSHLVAAQNYIEESEEKWVKSVNLSQAYSAKLYEKEKLIKDKEKEVKILIAQVNMYESMLAEKINKT